MLTNNAKKLIREMARMRVIDCHEHLASEKERVSRNADVFTLFSHYTGTDMATAGMDKKDQENLFNPEISLEERWKTFRPILSRIRHGSYARPAFIAAKELFGFDDINDDTYVELSEKIKEHNTPGIYKRILRDRCNIRVCLNQGSTTAEDGDQFVNLKWISDFTDLQSHRQYDEMCGRYAEKPRTLEDYIDLMRRTVVGWKAEGIGGIKIPRTWPWPEPCRKNAAAVFKRLLRKKTINLDEVYALEGYLVDKTLDIARDVDLPVAVHTGMWEDFPKIDAKNFIPWIMRHPDTRIDLYHLSMPSVRDAIIIGKNFPNVWLNLCWTHIVSPQMTRSAIDEILDLVPINKILGFGGDYGMPVEKVVGHLQMAIENIAVSLAKRIDDDLMDVDEALNIARMWLWDNPVELYKLKDLD